MAENPIKMVPITDLRTEAGAEELVRSDSMKPYLEVLKAEMGGFDTEPALAALATLPLKDRYVWRVVSALKWGLCDLDTDSVAADVGTLPEEDLKSVSKSLTLRAMQFSLFLKALVGEKMAKEIMLQALSCLGQ